MQVIPLQMFGNHSGVSEQKGCKLVVAKYVLEAFVLFNLGITGL